MLELEDNNYLPIVSIQRNRINTDGTGIRTLVHSYGCNLNCKWCCNPETRFAKNFVKCSIHDLFEVVKKDDIYFLASNGGITFSGGEPLLHYKFINEFSKKCKEMSWSLAVESAFYIKQEIIDDIIPNIDEFLIDIKSMDALTHKKYTGVSNEKILKNISYLSKKIDTNKIKISVPIIPNVNDTEVNIIQTLEFMKKNNLNKISLLPYRDYKKEKYDKMNLNYELNTTFNKEQFDKLKKIVNNF